MPPSFQCPKRSLRFTYSSARFIPPVKAVFRLKPQDPAVPLTMEVTAEFDGFCYFTGKIAPNSEIRSLLLEIPMNRKYTDAFDDCASPHYKTSLRQNTSFHVNAYTQPFFWCGGDEVGMMGGTATRRGWHVKNKAHSMHVSAGGREVLLALPVVDTPLKTGAAEREFSARFAPFIHSGNVEEIMLELERAERQIEQNGNAKIIFFDLCLQIIVLIKKKKA